MPDIELTANKITNAKPELNNVLCRKTHFGITVNVA